MKYKVTIEGNEEGYTQTLELDGKQVYQIAWERTETGAKAIREEPKQDDLEDYLYELVDNIDGGYDLMRFAEDWAQ